MRTAEIEKGQKRSTSKKDLTQKQGKKEEVGQQQGESIKEENDQRKEEI